MPDTPSTHEVAEATRGRRPAEPDVPREPPAETAPEGAASDAPRQVQPDGR